MSLFELIESNSMFANKTNTFIGRVNSLRNPHSEEGQIQVYKSDLDIRYTTKSEIVSHDGLTLSCTLVKTAKHIYNHVTQFGNLRVVAIDEVQLLDHNIINLTENLVKRGVIVIACGLTHSFRGEPFPFQLPDQFDEKEPRSPHTMGDYATFANERHQLKAYCMYEEKGSTCGKIAERIQRFKPGVKPKEPSHYTDQLLLISGPEDYMAVCSNHHKVPGKPNPFD